MANVEIYTTPYCPFCVRAKALLQRKGVAYTEVDVSGDSTLRNAMAERAEGRRSVPQIFINDQPIGGCDELHALDAKGKLDPLLAAA